VYRLVFFCRQVVGLQSAENHRSAKIACLQNSDAANYTLQQNNEMQEYCFSGSHEHATISACDVRVDICRKNRVFANAWMFLVARH
jgi:hypothetical protein